MSERRDPVTRRAQPARTRPAGQPRQAARRATAASARRAPTLRRPGRGVGWLKAQLARRPLPVWVPVVADVLVFAVALNVFALFHHVLPRRETVVGVTSQRGAAQTEVQPEAVSQAPVGSEPSTEQQQPAAADAPESTPQPSAQTDPEGYFGTKFAAQFTAGDVERTDTSYRSANIDLTITPYRQYDVDFYVMDFYLRDISSFQTAFAKDKFGRGQYERVEDTMARIGAIAAVNGDYYGGRSDGIVARNGTLYRNDDNIKRDVCVLYWNGEMKTFDPKGFDAEAEMARGAYQIWNFGPMLLDVNGQAMEKFNSDVNPANPRTAIGYFEPGHYCFVAVDGRSKASNGISLKNLSLLMQKLGCVRAYNMDGGQTSKMVYGTSVVNVPAGGGRMSTDIIALVEP